MSPIRDRRSIFCISRSASKICQLKFEIRNPKSEISAPLTFRPIFMERIWGGRKLAELFGKKLPANKRIGESWEIVDRPEAQSVVARGPRKDKTLHELWKEGRSLIFGEVPNAPRDRKSTRLNSSHVAISYAVFCLK